MEKKVIPIPDGTERIEVYSYASVDENGADFPNGSSSYDVKDLQDASEKPVIKLPAEMIKRLKDLRYGYTLLVFLEEATRINVVDQIVMMEDVDTTSPDKNPWANVQMLLAGWYLGHVKFVPKKKSKFEVEVKIGTVTKKALLSDANYVAFYSDPEHAPSGYQYMFSEEQADELVAGLTALNARKVKVEE